MFSYVYIFILLLVVVVVVLSLLLLLFGEGAYGIVWKAIDKKTREAGRRSLPTHYYQ